MFKKHIIFLITLIVAIVSIPVLPFINMTSIETDRIMYVTSLYSGNNTWHYVSKRIIFLKFEEVA